MGWKEGNAKVGEKHVLEKRTKIGGHGKYMQNLPGEEEGDEKLVDKVELPVNEVGVIERGGSNVGGAITRKETEKRRSSC